MDFCQYQLRGCNLEYTEGKVVLFMWGNEQTNVDFYKIMKRSGDWLSLAEMNHKDTYDSMSMTGTSVPSDVKAGGKVMRRKMHYRDGKESGVPFR